MDDAIVLGDGELASAELVEQLAALEQGLGGSAGVPAVAAFKAAFGAREVRHAVRWLDARHAAFAGRLVAATQAALRRRRARGEAA